MEIIVGFAVSVFPMMFLLKRFLPSGVPRKTPILTVAPITCRPKMGGGKRLPRVFLKNTFIQACRRWKAHTVIQPRILKQGNIFDFPRWFLISHRTKIGCFGPVFLGLFVMGPCDRDV